MDSGSRPVLRWNAFALVRRSLAHGLERKVPGRNYIVRRNRFRAKSHGYGEGASTLLGSSPKSEAFGATMPVDEYLRTPYSPDREYRDGANGGTSRYTRSCGFKSLYAGTRFRTSASTRFRISKDDIPRDRKEQVRSRMRLFP